MPTSTKLVVESVRGDRQKQSRDLRDSDGSGTITEQILQFGSDGVRLSYMEIVTSFAGVANRYEFQPAQPPLVLRPGLRPGDSTRFTLEGGRVRIDTTVTVGAREAASGGEVAVVTFSSQLSGALSGTQRTVYRMAVSDGASLREDVSSDVSSGGVRVQSQHTSTLSSRPRS